MKKKKKSEIKKCDYYCGTCVYGTNHQGNYKKHLSSAKHKKLCNIPEITPESKIEEKEEEKIYECKCGNVYKHRQSLHNHEQTCNYKEKSEELVTEENKPSYEDLIKIIGDLIPKVGNNNVTNNNINIQVFLDENCQDAMTIQNFANKLTLTINDLLKNRKMLGNVGNIVVDNLKPIPLLKRPIHCTDVSNRTWMVHDAEEGWKEDDGKKLIKETSCGITKKFQNLWESAYPDWKSDSELQQHYTSLVFEIMNPDYNDEDIEKILKELGPKCKLTLRQIEDSMKEG